MVMNVMIISKKLRETYYGFVILVTIHSPEELKRNHLQISVLKKKNHFSHLCQKKMYDLQNMCAYVYICILFFTLFYLHDLKCMYFKPQPLMKPGNL